jgi:Flp pilus assembly protein TadG
MKTITDLITALISEANRSERGQALILGVIALFALLGFTALTIDVGVGFGAKSQAQRAADSAAYAAALEHLLAGGSDAEAANVAYKWAAANGYDNSNPETTITVNIPPLSGPNAGDTFFVEVIIDDQEGTYFADVMGTEFWDITSRAVATTDTVPKPYGIITLNPNLCKATNVDGGVTIKITDAGTFTQSNCQPDAFHTQGSILVETEDNDVVGGWQVGGNVDPAPSKAYPIIDPLAGLPAPTPPDAPVHICPTFSGPAAVIDLSPGVYNCTLHPPGGWGLNFFEGEYLITGGLIMDGTGEATFDKSIFTLRGSGLLLTGNGTITSTETMFYIEEGSTTLTGTGAMSFTAPSTGTYKGVVLFHARDNTNLFTITGNSTQGGWGTVYAPAAQIDFSGNGSTNFQFISDTFYAHGNSDAQIIFRDGFLASVPYIWLAE